jgi:hypothetical protein
MAAKTGRWVPLLAAIAVACEPPLAPVKAEPVSTLGANDAPPVMVTQLGDGGADPPRGPKTCGCALCEPVFSDDVCKTDDDCAPAAPCHATACVAKSKAPPRPSGIMCTQVMVCASTDANACGCVGGRCALHAR